MSKLWLQGVVRNGQVVFDAPIDVPDGTVVTVTEYDPEDDPRPQAPAGPLPPTLVKEMMLGLLNRLDLLDDPNWQAKIGVARG